jgi:hypothetical protein
MNGIVTVVDRLFLDEGNDLNRSGERVILIEAADLIGVFVEGDFFVVGVRKGVVRFALLFGFGLMPTFLKFIEEFLGMGSNLRPRSSSNNFFNLFPIFSILHETKHEPLMLLFGPASRLFFLLGVFVGLHLKKIFR